MPYVFVGAHSESLDSGRQLVFGDLVTDLSSADQRLVEEGKLISAPEPPPTPTVSPVTQSTSNNEEAA